VGSFLGCVALAVATLGAEAVMTLCRPQKKGVTGTNAKINFQYSLSAKRE